MIAFDARRRLTYLAALFASGFALIVFFASTPEARAQSAASQISFVARPDGVDHIYIMSSDGNNIVRLTSGADRDFTPEWSRDGKKIVFQRSTDGDGIYTMNADGTNLTRLSPAPSHDGLPAWSPDGTRVIFSRLVAPPPGPGMLPITAIMEMNADGSNVRNIFSNGSFNMQPRYSPDGQRIAFMCGKAGTVVDICIVHPDGSGLEKLTRGGAVNGDPHWSHDGTKIAFGSNREGGGKVNIFVMNADGSNVTQLTHFPAGQEAGDVGWSSDDTLMVFEWARNGNSQSEPNAYAEIWMMNADGTNAHSTGVPCSGVGCGPRWRPG